MSGETKHVRTQQDQTDDFKAAFDLFWKNILLMCSESLPENSGDLEVVKSLCFYAMLTGCDWSLSQAPRSILAVLAAHHMQ
jgi:hypothetical protein